MSNIVLENLDMYYSNISSRLVNYEIEGSVLTGILDDGTRVLYNDFLNTIRHLPNNPNDMTDEEYRREFAYRLKDNMIKNGINQVELANRTGLSQAVISGYSNGRKMPSYQNAAKIASALNCSLDEFVYRG